MKLKEKQMHLKKFEHVLSSQLVYLKGMCWKINMVVSYWYFFPVFCTLLIEVLYYLLENADRLADNYLVPLTNRYSLIKAFCIAFVLTFFSAFDVPVFWPILLFYWIVLFISTMKRQIMHMVKYRYVPFTFGKQV